MSLTEIVALRTAAPDGSRTTPRMLPKVDCAFICGSNPAIAASMLKQRGNVIDFTSLRKHIRSYLHCQAKKLIDRESTVVCQEMFQGRKPIVENADRLI